MRFAAVVLVMFGALVSGCASGGTARLTESQVQVTTPEGASLAAVWKTHPATVLVWWSGSCPCVRRYEARVKEMATRYGAREVPFYYVASNSDDGPERLAQVSGPVPVVVDAGGQLARTLGVISTPTVAVVDREGAVRFLGWLDNEHDVGDPDREPWLEEALDEVLAGGAGTRKTPVWGCTVTRSLAEKKTCHSPAPAPVASEPPVASEAPVAPKKCGGH